MGSKGEITEICKDETGALEKTRCGSTQKLQEELQIICLCQ